MKQIPEIFMIRINTIIQKFIVLMIIIDNFNDSSIYLLSQNDEKAHN